jgi:hypothetical protein
MNGSCREALDLALVIALAGYSRLVIWRGHSLDTVSLKPLGSVTSN